MRLQRINARPDSWADRTLSALRASRTEACEKERAGLGGVGLFDAEATDLDAERLFDQSWYAREEREKRLHTLEELRTAMGPGEDGYLGLLREMIDRGDVPPYQR